MDSLPSCLCTWNFNRFWGAEQKWTSWKPHLCLDFYFSSVLLSQTVQRQRFLFQLILMDPEMGLRAISSVTDGSCWQWMKTTVLATWGSDLEHYGVSGFSSDGRRWLYPLPKCVGQLRASSEWHQGDLSVGLSLGHPLLRDVSRLFKFSFCFIILMITLFWAKRKKERIDWS